MNCGTFNQILYYFIVEDPSENFQRVRDFVDVANCLTLESFQKDKVQEGFKEEMFKEAKEQFKINKVEIRHFIIHWCQYCRKPLF